MGQNSVVSSCHFECINSDNRLTRCIVQLNVPANVACEMKVSNFCRKGDTKTAKMKEYSRSYKQYELVRGLGRLRGEFNLVFTNLRQAHVQVSVLLQPCNSQVT